MRIFTSLLCLVACAAKKHLVSRQITFGVTQYKAFANDLKNHDAAESACTKWGGHLVSIHNADEQRAIKSLLSSYNPAKVPAFWMGADERKKERNWVYTDGSHFDFTNWNSGQPTPHSIVPDGSPYDEDCTMIDTRTGRWDDELCTHVRPYLCSRTRPDACDCYKGCAASYSEKSGDMPGDGQINGKGGAAKVRTCGACAALCNSEPTCGSYECSPTELKCSLNTDIYPTAAAKGDYHFCVKGGCAKGFSEVSGDVPGWGSVNGKGAGQHVANCKACASLCLSDDECNSYECSSSELKCNLNRQTNPTQGQYKDYHFCVKGDLTDEFAHAVTASIDTQCGPPCIGNQQCGDGCSCDTRHPGCYEYEAMDGCSDKQRAQSGKFNGNAASHGGRLGDFCPSATTLPPTTTTTTTVHLVPYTTHFTNFCVDSNGRDLPQTNYPKGDNSIEACVSVCRKYSDCSAVEWYNSKWAGSKCKLMRGAFKATKGKQGRLWQDAQCYVLQPLPTTTTPEPAHVPPACEHVTVNQHAGEKYCSNIDEDAFKAFDVKHFNRDDVCEVLAVTHGHTCNDWCRAHGRICLYAEDNIGNTCRVDSRYKRQTGDNRGCMQKWNNQVCGCVEPDLLPVAILYKGKTCTGESRILRERDFVGGRLSNGWDACNGHWDDGTAMALQKTMTPNTWIGSIEVQPYYKVNLGNECQDDYNINSGGTASYQSKPVKDEDGCVDATFDSRLVRFVDRTPDEVDVPLACRSLTLGPGEIVCPDIRQQDFLSVNLTRINRDAVCEVQALTGKGQAGGHGTCTQWCQSKGMKCMYAQDNTEGRCKVDPAFMRQKNTNNGCDQKWADQICGCAEISTKTICNKGYFDQQAQNTYVIKAKDNTVPYTDGLPTRVNLKKGDRLILGVDPDDCWAAGSSIRTSDANGLGACAQESSCQDTCSSRFHKHMYTDPKSKHTFRFGALIGKIGKNGDWFLVGTNYDQVVDTAGTLYLGFWDVGNGGDNVGTVAVTVSGQAAQGTKQCVECEQACSRPCFFEPGLNTGQCHGLRDHHKSAQWTEWMDRDNQSGSGDYETVKNLRNEYPEIFAQCPKLLEIQGRVKDTQQPAAKSGDTLKWFDTTHGLVCLNKGNLGGCKDYEVRFRCSEKQVLSESLIECSQGSCRCKKCAVTFTEPTTPKPTTSRTHYCHPSDGFGKQIAGSDKRDGFRLSRWSECSYKQDRTPYINHAHITGTLEYCKACCRATDGCVAFEWDSKPVPHLQGANLKGSCTLAWGCDDKASNLLTDVYQSDCALNGVGYPKFDDMGNVEIKCPARPAVTRRCGPADFAGALGKDSNPFNLARSCLTLGRHPKDGAICGCVKQFDQDNVDRFLDCTFQGQNFKDFYAKHKDCDPFADDPFGGSGNGGTVVVHGRRRNLRNA